MAGLKTTSVPIPYYPTAEFHWAIALTIFIHGYKVVTALMYLHTKKYTLSQKYTLKSKAEEKISILDFLRDNLIGTPNANEFLYRSVCNSHPADLKIPEFSVIQAKLSSGPLCYHLHSVFPIG